MPLSKISLGAKVDKHIKIRLGAGHKQPSVIVGYTAAYALHVHENIEMKWQGLPRHKPAKGVYWGPAGQAKFLEQPAREMKDQIAQMVRTAMRNGATMQEALYLAGLALQRASQLLVPTDTSNLKNSAFTRNDPISV